MEYIDHKLRGEPRPGARKSKLSSKILGEQLSGASEQTGALLTPRSPESCNPLPHMLLQVLPLVSGEIYQVPESQCIHNGEPHCPATPCSQAPWPRCCHLSCPTAGKLMTSLVTDLSISPRLPSMERISASQPKTPSCCSCEILSGQALLYTPTPHSTRTPGDLFSKAGFMCMLCSGH